MPTHFMSKVFFSVAALIAPVILSSPVYSQLNDNSRVQRDAYFRTESDLAKDNLEYVAASSVQIREVLVKDAGLFVELKRFVAKEASDNGQMVQEANLSDQAIFERLERDIKFRSIATR